MSDDKKYNGWSNYETWNVALWLDNDQGTCELMNEWAQECYNDASADNTFTQEERAALNLSDRIKEMHEENTPTVTGVYADLLNASLGEVNWHEIAERYIEDVDKDVEDEDA
jgi:hypothetical protein